MKRTSDGWWSDQRSADLDYCSSNLALSIPANAMLVRALSSGRRIEEADVMGELVTTLSALLTALEGLGGHVVWTRLHDAWSGAPQPGSAMVSWPWASLAIDGAPVGRWIRAHLSSADPELTPRILGMLREQLQRPTARSRTAFAICAYEGGATLEPLGVSGIPLRRENYGPEVLAAYDHVAHELGTQDPCGRITIFDGPPGTGKTHLVRALISESPARFVVAPPGLLAALGGPGLLPLLLRQRRGAREHPLVLVIEDADACLVPRGADNIAEIASLLNLGDGIIGSSIDLRIVLTTNARHVEIDAAVTRPGRLCRRVHVGPLSAESANGVLRSLLGGETPPAVGGPVSLAEVYAEARRAGWTGRPHDASDGEDP